MLADYSEVGTPLAVARHAVLQVKHEAVSEVITPHPTNDTPSDPKLVRAAVVVALDDDESIARIHRKAEVYARLPRGAPLVRELVTDVIGETWEGGLRWTPGKPEFELHVVDEVKARIAYRRARSRAHPPIEELSEDDEPATEMLTQGHTLDVAAIVAEVRARVQDDDAALQLLTAFDLGMVRKRELLALGMSSAAYCSARARLMSATRSVLAVVARDTGLPLEELAALVRTNTRRLTTAGGKRAAGVGRLRIAAAPRR